MDRALAIAYDAIMIATSLNDQPSLDTGAATVSAVLADYSAERNPRRLATATATAIQNRTTKLRPYEVFGTPVETACAPNPWAHVAGDGAGIQSCIVDWPTTPWQPWISPHVPVSPMVPLQHTHYHFTPAPLSDADVDRIAKRVVELLKAAM